ncbi:MAG TPA: M17 family metallopeptidase [Motilibacterales bacterium]|nr:M17 family metallopeptidase [Motilibacterales bacterium]
MHALPEMLVEAVADPLGEPAGGPPPRVASAAGDPGSAADPGSAGDRGDRCPAHPAPTDDNALADPGVRDDPIGGAQPGPGVVIIGVHPASSPDEPPRVDQSVVDLLGSWGVDLPRRLSRTRASGARSEAVWIDLEREEPAAVLALGLGSGTPAEVRRSAAAAVRRVRGTDDVLVLATRGLDEAAVRAFTEGLFLGTGTPTWATTPPPGPPSRVRLAVGDVVAGQRAVEEGRLHAGATLAARILVHTPPNIKDPAWMAGQAGELAAESGLTIRVLDEVELARAGFGGLVAVGAGSVRPPRLVQLEWAPAGPDAARHVVLVGKGITFDSGGLSLKPPDMQVAMKTDMSGAAAVCAVMGALAQKPPPGLRVTGLLCLAENLPGATATRPGDVVTHHGGLTSEVVNTDAEGRLVLADGLDYAVNDLAADVVVDIATLTGAATLGLGRRHAALFSTSDALADGLAAAGEAAGELMWRMPLHAGYAELIASEVADQANAESRPGPGPGAITAALFLARFVGTTPWAHLDIAGVGRSEAERDDIPKGGTGFGARALLRWLEAGAPA